MTNQVMPFKIAMREEGQWIICYLATPLMYQDPNYPPMEMGRIHKNVLIASGGRDKFLEIMQDGVEAILPPGTPKPDWKILRAPENEKTREV